MDPLDLPDPGGLGGAIDGLTGTVRSVEEFADAVNDVTSFELVLPILWALIALMAASRFMKWTQGWSDAGAQRYREGRPIIGRRTAKEYEAEIAELKAKLAEALGQAAEHVGMDAPAKPQLVASNLER